MSRLDEPARPRLRLLRQPVDDEHRRPPLGERAGDGFADLPLATDPS
jgi:hypothetical protein